MIRTILTRARRHRSLAAVAGILASLAAAAAVHAATSPDFSLTAQPPNQTIASGAAASYVVSITPANGFAAAVTLTASNLPKGMSASWTVGGTTTSGPTSTVPAGSATRTATLTLGGGQPTAGSYSPVVTATSGALSRTATLSLTVVTQNAANFSLAVSPSSQTVAQGTVSSSVTINRANWSGSVALTVSGLPTGATASLTPSSTTGSSSSLVITTNASTPAGTYAVNVAGAGSLSGQGTATRYGTFTLTVLPPFSITGNLSAPMALGLGGRQSLDLSIANPYSSPLTVSNLQVALASVQQAAGATGTCNQSGANSPNFAITNLPASYQVTIPAQTTARLSQLGTHQQPTVTWLDQPGFPQNGCLGAHLTFTYAGTGSF